MKNVLAIALAAPMMLIGAAYPGDKMDYESGAGMEPMAEAITYRPCRPGRGDDRCIQLYERGVRASYARWLRDRGVPGAPTQVAMGGPIEERARRPHRRHAHDGDHRGGGGRGERCHNEPPAHDGEARGM